MKALTIPQPLACLVALGGLRLYSGMRDVDHRGAVAVYAPKATPWGRSRAQDRPAADYIAAADYHEDSMPELAVVAVARIVDCAQLVAIDGEPGATFLRGRGGLVPLQFIPDRPAYRQLVDVSANRWLVFFDAGSRRISPVHVAGQPRGLWDLSSSDSRKVAAQVGLTLKELESWPGPLER